MPAIPGDNRIQMTIIGGFLGAGKSTWLRHQLFEGAYNGSYVIVNEVGPSAVDDILLQHANQLHVLSGKCACCDGQDQMIRLLKNICNERTRNQVHLSSALIFEMTGVADPANVLDAIQADPILSRHIVLKETIVIADGLDGFAQINTEQLARQQIEAADRILISKVDQASAKELARLKSVLSALNPAAPIKQVQNGVESDLAHLPTVDTPQLTQIGALNDAPIETTHIDLKNDKSGNTDWAGLTVWLSAMLYRYGTSLLRVKGVVQTPAGRLLLQSVRQRIQAPVVLPSKSASPVKLDLKDNKIILIGRGLCQSNISQSVDRFLDASR